MTGGMGVIGAEDFHLAGIVVEVLEGQLHMGLIGVPLDIGVELGLGELAVDHEAFQPRHVDAVGGEAAQRLVDGGGHVAHVKDKTGDDRPLGGIGIEGRTGENEEAGGVVFGVLDIGAQHLKPR